MSPTKLRDRAFASAAADPEGALAIARSIDDPWFRCQALSAAAEHTPDDNARRRIVVEAFRAANATREPNRIVSVSAWPLRVLCNAGDWRTVSAEIDRLLAVISQEPHPTRRNDALYWIWHLVRPQRVSAPFARLLDAFRKAYVRLGTGFSIQEMAVPTAWENRSLRDLSLRHGYKLAVVAVHDVLTDEWTVVPDPDSPLKESDTLLVAGRDEDLSKLAQLK